MCAAPSRAGGCIASMRGQPMQAWAESFVAASERCASHELLPCVALAVMMAGCVLLCSTFKGRRVHCRHEGASHWTLKCNGTAPTSSFHKLVQHVISDFACLEKGGDVKEVALVMYVVSLWHYVLASLHLALSMCECTQGCREFESLLSTLPTIVPLSTCRPCRPMSAVDLCRPVDLVVDSG